MVMVDDITYNRFHKKAALSLANHEKPSIVFICTQNSARSQMAEGLLRAMAGDRYTVESCGTEPSTVHPLAIRVLGEIGIDISRQRSKGIDTFSGIQFDYVVTVCDNAKESCPFLKARRRNLHRSFQDPAAAGETEGEKLANFRQVRDEIKSWLEATFGI